jgi:hypothetical protein
MPKQRSEKRKRQNRRTLRFDDSELNLTIAMAERAGLEWSSWARQALLNAPVDRARPTPCIERQALGEALGKLNRIGGNHYQLLKAVRFGGQYDPSEITEAEAEIDATCRAIREAIGKPSGGRPDGRPGEPKP